jgi:hypothetical protein
MTGEVELSLLAFASSSAPLPRRISTVLAAALEHIGGRRTDLDEVHRLPVGDRQFLARRLAGALGQDILWLAPRCSACGARFDVRIVQSSLPVKEAGPSFPWTEAVLSWGRCRLRVPTGEDQEAVADIPDDDDAVRALARRCIVAPLPPPGTDLTDGDVSRVEQALESVAPEVTSLAESTCPECGEVNRIPLDPYACITAGSDDLWDEVHEIATVYHWSERDILALPRERRRSYLNRIARSRGERQAGVSGPVR